MTDERRLARPQPGPRRVAAVLVAAVLLGGCSRVSNYGLLEPASRQAEAVTGLYRVFFWVAAAIAVIVYGLIVWAVIRYRHRSRALPSQRQYHVPLEIFYTVVPLLIVIGLFIGTTRTQTDVGAVSDDPDLRVEVTAFQWDWRFAYPDHDVVVSGSPEQTAELVLPAQSTVRLTVTSEDVIHSLWVPALLFKRDMFPGATSTFDVDTTREGVFAGRCAEFCGLQHAAMDFQVRVLGAEEFGRWLDEQAGTS